MTTRIITTTKELVSAAKTLVRFAIEHNGFFPSQVFELLTFLAKGSSFELAILARHPETQEPHVYLVQRPLGDYWEKMWHMPGTTIRPFESKDKCMNRLFQSEVFKQHIQTSGRDPVLLFDHVTVKKTDGKLRSPFPDIPDGRGGTLHNLYVLWVNWQDPAFGKFYKLDELPEGTIKHHQHMVAELLHRLNNPTSHLREQRYALGFNPDR